MFVRRIRTAAVVFVAVVIAGTVGYRLLEGWSWLDALWMVAITLTTIGYGEVHPLSEAGRVFTLALLLGGLSVGSYAAAEATRYVLEGGLQRDYQARRRRKLMDSLHDHFIVAGFGRTGREVAADLKHAGERVVVIDPAPSACEACQEAGFAALPGDASSDQLLRDAGIERAKGLAVATSSDAVNVFVTLSARQLNPKLKIITRVDDQDAASKAMRAGADGVVSPHAIGGTTIANSLLRPHSATFMANAFARTHPDLSMEDVRIGDVPELHGPLGTLGIREQHQVIVAAVQHADGTLVAAPGPDAELRAGDVLVVMGRPEDVVRMRVRAAG